MVVDWRGSSTLGGRRLVLNKGSPLERILKILAICAFAVAGAQDTYLKALAILLEAARLLARAAFHVVGVGRDLVLLD